MSLPAGLTIVPAVSTDAEAIVDLMSPYVAQQIVLPRSVAEIRANIANFRVVRQASSTSLVGCVALRDFGQGLQEVRSLVVAPEHAGRGLGTILVQTAIEMARERQANRVFTLTVRPNLFLKLGFTHVPVTDFPQKVWSDCAHCPKREQCDEVALAIDLN